MVAPLVHLSPLTAEEGMTGVSVGVCRAGWHGRSWNFLLSRSLCLPLTSCWRLTVWDQSTLFSVYSLVTSPLHLSPSRDTSELTTKPSERQVTMLNAGATLIAILGRVDGRKNNAWPHRALIRAPVFAIQSHQRLLN